MEIYGPEEDSRLLEGFVRELARGRVLDVGTGSGIQAVAALSRGEVREVVAVDINEDALAALKKKKKELKLEKLKVHRSDLFSSVKGRFDTIIFNPPYLPEDENDPDAALDGGKVGNEMIERFLSGALHHLEDKGFILLLFSNRSGKDTLDKIGGAGYSAELLGKQSLPFFEELYVYRLTFSGGRKVFSKGKRGVVYREGNVCIKEKNPESKVDTLANEARMLRLVNKAGIGPTFISFDGKGLRRDFVEGIPLGEFLEACSKKDAILVMKDVLSQCRTLDKMKINKTELIKPYKDIIITPPKKAVLIDFERCKETGKPQNVTQFLQYLSREKRILGGKGVGIDRAALVLLAKAYKKSLSDDDFKKILAILR